MLNALLSCLIGSISHHDNDGLIFCYPFDGVLDVLHFILLERYS